MEAVPVALHERLGPDASRALLDLLARSHEEARADVIIACTERFERRLVEEVSTLRVQLAHVQSSLREEMAAQRSSLREEMAAQGASLREEMAGLGASLRGEMADLRATLREDIAGVRVDLLKWTFLFWIGQALAVAGMLGVVLRMMR
jgi:hypothetical protein